MDDPDVAVRRYASDDADALWGLKRAFELELGSGTGDGEKAARYEAKLTDAYRRRYVAWVGRCVDEEPDCVRVAAADDGAVGYAFLLPASLAMIWDAAVLNEIYVRPAARGSGVADALLDAAVATARAQDLPLDRLVLDVDPDNGRARAFYDRHGFEPWGELVARRL
ncbi:MAG: N-acetyltransferase family protein [Haloferacaceae archaeon]